MTKISTIHDAIVTKISTNLTGYKQLPNPYDIEDNNKLYLTKGFGVAIDTGVRTNRVVGCQTSWERSFLVTLINKVTTTDHNITVRETLAKGLLEDHFTLLKQFDKDASLSGTAIDAVVDSDGGIEFTDIDSIRYYLIELEIRAEYLEDLN